MSEDSKDLVITAEGASSSLVSGDTLSRPSETSLNSRVSYTHPLYAGQPPAVIHLLDHFMCIRTQAPLPPHCLRKIVSEYEPK